MLCDTSDFPDIPESEAAANQPGRNRDYGTFLPPGNEPFLSSKAVVADEAAPRRGGGGGDSHKPAEGAKREWLG